MPEYRTVIVVAVIAVCATVAACFNVLSPELMGILGSCLAAWIGKKMLDAPAGIPKS